MRKFEAWKGEINQNQKLNILELLIKEVWDVVVSLLQWIDETLKEINILQNNIFISILLRDDIYNPDEERRLKKKTRWKITKGDWKNKKISKIFLKIFKIYWKI